MNTLKQKVFLLIFGCLCVVLGIFAGMNIDVLRTALSNKPLTDNIFYSAFTEDNYYSIVNSRSEIVVLNKEGICIDTIVPDRGGAVNINGILPDPDNNHLYIWCTYFDETNSFIDSEEILLYSVDAKFIGAVYSLQHADYEAVPVSGRIRNLAILENGNLGFAITDDSSVITMEINNSGYLLSQVIFPYANASYIVFDVFMDGNISDIYFSTKQGQILKSGNSSADFLLIYDVGEEGIFVPAKIHVLNDGSILVKESFNYEVSKITPDGQLKTLISATDDGLDEITSFFVYGNSLIISDNYQILEYSLTVDSAVNINAVDKLKYGTWDYIKSYVLLALIFIAIIFILFFGSKIIKKLSSDNKQILRQTLIIGISLAVTSGIIAYYVFDTLDERTLDANYNLLTIHFEYLSNIIDAERVENINNVSQFDSEDFNIVIEQLNQSLTIVGEQDYSKYIGIMKNFDGKIVIITYQDMDEYFFTPVFSDYQVDGLYLPAFNDGELIKNYSNDAEGRWQYVFGPIYNDEGEIIAVAEIGFDLTPYEEADNALFMDLLLRLVSILAVIMLLFIEFTIYESKVINKRTLAVKTDDDILSISGGSVRGVSVLLFVGTYLNATFMPVFSSNLYSDLFGMSKDIVISIPIVTESVFLIISILGFSRFKKKVNFKLAILLGGIVYAAGNIFTAFSLNTVHLILARAVVGIGYGIIYIALRAYIAGSDEKLSSEELIAYGAGMTCGVSVGGVLGSIIADFIGFRYTFLAVAAIILVAALTAWRILDSRYSTVSEFNSESSSAAKFLFNKDVIIYYLFEFLPAAICGAFLLYFLPLIANRLGYSTTLVGQIFLLNALFSIYSGPMLTRITTKFFGAKNSLIFAGFIYSAAIFLVAFNTESILIVAVCAIIIGIADSFKENQESDYFLELDICKSIGETKAVSYFGIFECSGEAIGPMVYALILSMGVSNGLMSLGVILPVAVIIFGIGSRKKFTNITKDNGVSA